MPGQTQPAAEGSISEQRVGDITTPGQWNKHVQAHGQHWNGIAILYERGVGVVENRFVSGAGVGLTSLKAGWNLGK